MQVVTVDTTKKADVKRFIRLPFEIYRGSKQWVPQLNTDAMLPLNRTKHPFYEHSDAEFFLALEGEEVVGRISVLENRRYNEMRDERCAFFYHFECVDDGAVALALFERAFECARGRGMNKIIGPKGMGVFDGMGMLVEGFEHRPAMTMVPYNQPYYPAFVEAAGFEKMIDVVSCRLGAGDFKLPERVHRIADRVMRRGNLRVHTFRKKSEIRALAPQLGRAYNEAFHDNWEFVPITDAELKLLIDDLLTIADPGLIKMIMHGDDVAGFLLAFPDVSKALQRSKGRLTPLSIADLLLWEPRHTDWVLLNGAGILEQYRGRGGNALLYSEMEKTLRQSGRYAYADLAQIAETAVQMRSDLINLGGDPYKNHRVYRRAL